MIPRFAPTYTYRDIFTGIKRVPTKGFEQEITLALSKLCKMKYVFLTKNARSGLYTILKAYNRPGNVLVPAYNCLSVPEAVYYAGYKPSFVDIELTKLSSLPESFERMISPETTVVIPTHLFGIPCKIDEIREICRQKDLLVLEDAAPALGAEYRGEIAGSFGDASVISFGGRKVIYGEAGGAILTNSEELAMKIKELLGLSGNRGYQLSLSIKAIMNKTALNPFIYTVIRHCYALIYREKMYEIIPAHLDRPANYLENIPYYSCALIQLQLDRLAWNLERRRSIAKIYREQLVNQPGWILPDLPESSLPSWIQFPILCDNKMAFYKHMRSEGVDTSWTYKYSCAESFGDNSCMNAQLAAKKVISLPTTPYISDQQAYQICSKVLKYHSQIH
jgi:dTDP-4-amino-4,6-dideoxygalactose transaminase